jgi:hypothetical protein
VVPRPGASYEAGDGGGAMNVRSVIVSHGHFAHGGDPDGAGEAWEEAGFQAAEVHEWLDARCFSPAAARDLADVGVTPEMARMKTSQGAGDYVDTVAFKVSDGDLAPEEARDLVGAF